MKLGSNESNAGGMDVAAGLSQAGRMTHEHAQFLTSVLSCQFFACAIGASFIIEISRKFSLLPTGWVAGLVVTAAWCVTLAWYVALSDYHNIQFPRDFGLLACFTVSSSCSLGIFGAFIHLEQANGYYVLVLPLLVGTFFLSKGCLASVLFGKRFNLMPLTCLFISHASDLCIWLFFLAMYGLSSHIVISLLGAMFFPNFMLLTLAIANDRLEDDPRRLSTACIDLFIDANIWLAFSGIACTLIFLHIEDPSEAIILWFGALFFVNAAVLAFMCLSSLCKHHPDDNENCVTQTDMDPGDAAI